MVYYRGFVLPNGKYIGYIMTRKVNQDVVKNMFSFLKGICGAALNNITPLQFKYAYITIFLNFSTYNI